MLKHLIVDDYIGENLEKHCIKFLVLKIIA